MTKFNWLLKAAACGGACIILPACVPSPAPAPPAVRDQIVFNEYQYHEFLTGMSYNADARLFLNQQKLDFLAKTNQERTRLADLRLALKRPLAKNVKAVRLSGLQTAVRNLITQVSLDHGLNPSFFHALANRESRFDYLAKAPTSSAGGLFQFTESTWLCALRIYGPNYGLQEASQIIVRPSGQCSVADKVLRTRLLGMRYNPTFSTHIAIEHTMANRSYLIAHRHSATKADLYALHFFGQPDGMRFLSANPLAYAASVTPRAAQANKTIFYDHGRPRRVFEVYRSFNNL